MGDYLYLDEQSEALVFLTTNRVSKIYRLYILYTFPMIILKFYKSNMSQKLFVYVLSPFFKIGIVRN